MAQRQIVSRFGIAVLAFVGVSAGAVSVWNEILEAGLVATGRFHAVEFETTGRVEVRRDRGQGMVLRLERMQSRPGCAEVLLLAAGDVRDALMVESTERMSLGRWAGPDLRIPGETDLRRFRTVLLRATEGGWVCGAAPLQTAAWRDE